MRTALQALLLLAIWAVTLVSCSNTVAFYSDNGHVYELVDAGRPLNSTEANAVAKARYMNGQQGYLVTISSAAESAVLYDIFRAQAPPLGLTYPTLWAGAVREGNSWFWYALTRKSASFYDVSSKTCNTYCNWYQEVFPDNSTCLQIYSTSNLPNAPEPGKWKPADCSGLSEDVIVEYDAGTTCSSGYVYSSAKGWCVPVSTPTTTTTTLPPIITTTTLPPTTTEQPTSPPVITTTTVAPITSTEVPPSPNTTTTTEPPVTTTNSPNSTTTESPVTSTTLAPTTTESPVTTTLSPNTTTTETPATTTLSPNTTTTESPVTTHSPNTTTTQSPNTTTTPSPITTESPSTTTLSPNTTTTPSPNTTTTPSPNSTTTTPSPVSTTTASPNSTTTTPSPNSTTTTPSPNSTTTTPSPNSTTTTPSPNSTTTTPSPNSTTTTPSPNSTTTAAPTTTTHSPNTTTTASPNTTTTASPNTTTTASPNTTTTASPNTTTTASPNTTTTASPNTTTTAFPNTTTTTVSPGGRPFVNNATMAPTSGGVITIRGGNFGNNKDAIMVWLGMDTCSNVALLQSGSVISCTAAAGVGANIHVTVTVANVSNTDDNTAFSRLPPKVTSVQLRIDTASLIIAGQNFGAMADYATVIADNVTCVIASISHYNIVCQYDPSEADWSKADNKFVSLDVNIYGQHAEYLIVPADFIDAAPSLQVVGSLLVALLLTSLIM